MSRYRRIVLVICSAYICACAGESGGTGFDVDLASLPEQRLQEVFRLGGADEPEQETFQGEPQLTVDRQQALYVLHPDLGRVAVFDSLGGFVRWIGGGLGEGPGEFTTPMRFGFIADTLWVRNRTPPQISTFHVDGTYLETDQLVVDPGYRTSAGVQGVSGYLQGGQAWMQPDGFLRGSGDSEPRAPFMVGDREMETRSTLFDWRASRGRLSGTSFNPVPEPPFHDVAPDGSGIVLAEWTPANPEELLVRFFSPRGEELRTFTLPVPPVRIPASVRDSLVEAGREVVRGVRERVIAAGISAEQAPAVPTAEEVRAAAYLPEFRPPIAGVLIGLDGTIWLDRAGSSPRSWVVLDGNGTPLFRVRLPEGHRLQQASSAAVWTTTSDERGVPYVIRWNLGAP